MAASARVATSVPAALDHSATAPVRPSASVVSKSPSDPGVIGLDFFRAVAGGAAGGAAGAHTEASASKKKPMVATQWGSESEEDKAKKAALVASGRDRLDDTTLVVRNLIRFSVIATLFRMAISRMFSALLPEPWSRPTSWVFALLVFYRSYAAPSPQLPPHRTGYFHELPFFGSLLTTAKHRKTAHNFLLNAIRENDFKTVEVRVPGPSRIFFLMEPLDREYVLKTNWKNYLKNRPGDVASIEMTLGEVLGRGIFATDGLEWQDARKIASHMFSGNGLKHQMEAVFNSHAEHTVEAFQKLAGEGRVVDLQEIFQCVVFDAFCEIAFGVFPNAAASALGGVKPPFLVSFDFCQLFSSERVIQMPLQWQLSRLLARTTGMGPDAEFLKHLKVIDDYVYKVVRSRLHSNEATGKNDLLSLYINYARETGQVHMLDEVYLRDVIVNFMIAGRDTTSCTLTNLCRYLSEHPKVVERLRAEDFNRAGARVTWETANQLHFTHAAINETIRLAPPVGDDFKIAVGDDVLPSGITIRDGDRVFMANAAIGRDPRLWSNPDTFNPERWMSYDQLGVAQKVRRPDEFVFPVFWSGARLCLGKDMARFESTVFAAKIFSKLNVVSEPGQDKDNHYVTGPVIFYSKGWRVRFEPI